MVAVSGGMRGGTLSHCGCLTITLTPLARPGQSYIGNGLMLAEAEPEPNGGSPVSALADAGGAQPARLALSAGDR